MLFNKPFKNNNLLEKSLIVSQHST